MNEDSEYGASPDPPSWCHCDYSMGWRSILDKHLEEISQLNNREYYEQFKYYARWMKDRYKK